MNRRGAGAGDARRCGRFNPRQGRSAPDPAALVGEKLWGHWRADSVGYKDGGDKPVWFNGLDRYQQAAFADPAETLLSIQANVLDSRPAFRIPGTTGAGKSYFLGRSLAVTGSRPHLYVLAKVNALCTQDAEQGIVAKLVPSGQTPAAHIRFGKTGDGYLTGATQTGKILCQMNYNGDAGTAAEVSVAFTVPSAAAHLFSLHYDSDQGHFELDGVQYDVPTGGAAVSSAWDNTNGTRATFLRLGGGSSGTATPAQADVVDLVLAYELTAAEKLAIKANYFARRYPSLVLS